MKRTALKRKAPFKQKSGLKRNPIKRKSKTTQAAKKRRKRGEWSTKTADTYFSLYIRERDGKCLRCGTTENLTCSHYHRRSISATRYCEDNNIALCATCHHDWEGPKTGYTELMIKRLGVDRFLALQLKAGTMVKRADAVADWKQRYELHNMRRQSV